ncbi:MAG: prolipoprotein diacylglyceryl transferase [Armatimonadetes bacterium]|nr:prolipoprotein diacylglyceryl transferase [Armatimonadota bacterium]
MRPILFEIPAIPIWGWVILLSGFFGLSAYWGARDVVADAASAEERRRRVRSTLLTNLLLFALGAALVWRFGEALARPLPVRAYGFLLMLAFAAGLVCLQRVARGTALSAESAVDVMLGLLLVSVLSSRVMYILLNWGQYAGHWRALLQVWEGGLSFHGGLLGGILWVAWYARRHRLGFLWLADLMVPGLALGYAIARVGCFLNGCCYGTPTHLPWAVRFQDPPLSNQWTEPSHPVQIYASLTNLVIFAIILRLARRKRFDGQVLGAYLVLYSAYRFGAEWLRKGVTGSLLALGMTQAQWASLGVAAVGALMVALLARRAEKTAVTATGRRDDREPRARPDAAKDTLSAERADRDGKVRGSASVPPRGKARKRR